MTCTEGDGADEREVFSEKGGISNRAGNGAYGIILPSLCGKRGVCGYWKLWIFAGITFGIHRLYFRLIPKGSDLGGYLLEGQSAAWCLHGGLPWRYSGLRKEFC